MEADFEKMVRDAGIPTTEPEMVAEWNRINKEQNSLILNDSRWSAFWQIVTAIVTRPAVWLVRFMITVMLPNSFLKTAEGKFLDMKAWALSVERKPSAKTQGVVRFLIDDASRETRVPAMSRVTSTDINGTIYSLFTVEEAVATEGESALDILCEAEEPGKAWNLAPGYFSVLPKPIPNIKSVNNSDPDWITTPGADSESNEDLRDRCRNQFAAVGQFHHDAFYRAIVSKFAGVSVNYIWFEHGAPRGPGSANIYVMVDEGAPSESFIKSINDQINTNGYHGHGDDILVLAMPSVPMELHADVWLVDGVDAQAQADLLQQIDNMIRCAFRQNQDFKMTKPLPFGRFSISKMCQELHDQVSGLASIEFDDNADVITEMNLPSLQTLELRLQTATGFYL